MSEENQLLPSFAYGFSTLNILAPVATKSTHLRQGGQLPRPVPVCSQWQVLRLQEPGWRPPGRSLGTCDRKIAERRLKEWIGHLDKVDAEVENTTLGQLIQRQVVVTGSMSESSRTSDQSIIKRFLAWWPYGRECQVRQIRPSMLDAWLAHEEPRFRNVTYNRYAGFLKQLFDIAVKDRIIPESPAKLLR